MLPAATTGTSIGRPRSHSTICTAGARMAAPPGRARRQPGRMVPVGAAVATTAIDGCRAAAPQSSGKAMNPASSGLPGR